MAWSTPCKRYFRVKSPGKPVILRPLDDRLVSASGDDLHQAGRDFELVLVNVRIIRHREGDGQQRFRSFRRSHCTEGVNKAVSASCAIIVIITAVKTAIASQQVFFQIVIFALLFSMYKDHRRRHWRRSLPGAQTETLRSLFTTCQTAECFASSLLKRDVLKPSCSAASASRKPFAAKASSAAATHRETPLP